jgi:hypothetical protein
MDKKLVQYRGLAPVIEKPNLLMLLLSGRISYTVYFVLDTMNQCLRKEVRQFIMVSVAAFMSCF